MLGNTKSLKRNNRKCKGILIVPSMALVFCFEDQDSAVVYPTHSPNRAVGFRPKFRGADGKPTTEPFQGMRVDLNTLASLQGAECQQLTSHFQEH